MPRRDNEAIFTANSLERSEALRGLMQYPTAADRISGLFELYPQTRFCTHEYIGSLVGLTREAVTRAIGRMHGKR